MIALLPLGRVVQSDADRLAHEVHGADVAGAVGRENEGIVLGHPLHGVLVGRLLVLQAAHEAAARAGNFRRIQAEILCLGHLDGHGHKVVQKLRAAERTAADAEAAEHFGLVAHADLTQLDAGAEHAREVAHELAEVHAPLGGEEEHDLAAVKAALHAHELHVQPALGDLPLADAEGILLALTVVLHRAAVVFRRDAHESAQRTDDRAVVHLVVAGQALGVFGALRRLDDDELTRLHGDAVRVEIILLAAAAKADANHFSQRISSNSTARPPSSGPTPTLYSQWFR